MKATLRVIDWEYPATRCTPPAETVDLENDLMNLYLEIANGVVLEMLAQGDSPEAVTILRNLICGAGSGRTVELTPAEKEQLWLFTPGCEVYKQGGRDSDGGFFFLDPNPVTPQ